MIIKPLAEEAIANDALLLQYIDYNKNMPKCIAKQVTKRAEKINHKHVKVAMCWLAPENMIYTITTRKEIDDNATVYEKDVYCCLT